VGLRGESFLFSKSKSLRMTASSMLRTMSYIIPELFATFFLISQKLLIAALQLSIKSLMPKLLRFFD
jgi:hypothetical protein